LERANEIESQRVVSEREQEIGQAQEQKKI
jgi:hypothetical protein